MLRSVSRSSWCSGSHWQNTPPASSRRRTASKCSTVYSEPEPLRAGWKLSETITS